MRPVLKMLLLFALLIFGSALVFVILDEEDTGAQNLTCKERASLGIQAFATQASGMKSGEFSVNGRK